MSDLADFTSSCRYDAAVMSESLYYLELEEAGRLLERLKTLLVDGGSLVIRIHDARRHSSYLAAVEKAYPQAKTFITKTGQVYFVVRNAPPSSINAASL
jgi:trans-aconitate methyltransferase